jgi:hypothetical protein
MVEITRERRIGGTSCSSLWDVIESVQRLPDWLTICTTAELLGGQGLGRRQRLRGRWGRRQSEIDQIVIAYEPDRLLAWRHDAERLDGRNAPQLSRETTFRIELEPSGPDVVIKLRSRHVPANAVTGLMLRLIAAPRAARMLEESLDRLSALVHPRTGTVS